MDNRITIDPAVCHGKPCIRGLRYPVESVLEWLAAGMSIDNILADYADLERDDILAVLAFAARLAHVNRIELIAACGRSHCAADPRMNKLSSKTRQQQTRTQKDARAAATRAAKVKRALAVRANKAWPTEKFARVDAYRE